MGDNPIFEVIEKKLCCGCEACVQACPTGILEMGYAKDGFAYPKLIHHELCTECNLCINSCNQFKPLDSVLNNNFDGVRYFGGFSFDEEKVTQSSSGGIFSEIIESFLNHYKNTYYVGVVWSDDYNKTTFEITNELGKLERYRRSKYVQADKNGIYKIIESYLKQGRNILFSGCPCEVGGLKKYLKKEYDNLFTLDFVCKGATSPLIWKEYINLVAGKRRVKEINMRVPGKDNWIPQIMKIEFENGSKITKDFYNTVFGKIFHFYQRESCFQCKYNNNYRLSDITMGDFHGANNKADYYNSKGTSVISINSEKGTFIYNLIKERCRLIELKFDDVSKYNPCMIEPMKKNIERDSFEKNYGKYGLIGAYIRIGLGDK